MLNNKADFILDYNERASSSLSKTLKRDDVDWSQSRIIFISPEFTKYQQYAIGFKDLGIQLWEVHKYSNSLIGFYEIKPIDRQESISTITKRNPIAEKVTEEIRVYTEEDHDIESELVNVQEKELSVSLTIYYKPVSDVRIIENICFRKNIFYHFCTEHIAYFFTIPGMSIKDLTTKYYTFKPKLEDVEEAFMLLMKNHLIRPLMEFRGETKFVFTDSALSQLMNDLYSFYKLENENSYVKWNYIGEPTLEERERRKAFFSDKMSSQQLFNKAEINRIDFRKKRREKKIKEELIPLTKLLEENVNKFEHAKIYYLKYIKKKYEKTIKEYAFLLNDIFRIIFPPLL